MDPLQHQHYSQVEQQQQQQQHQPQIITNMPQNLHHHHHHHNPPTMEINQQQQQQQPHHAQQQPIDNIDEVMQQLMILVRETQDTDNMVQKNRDIYQNFVIQLQTRSRYITNITYAERSPQYAPNINLELSKRELANIELALREKAALLDRTRHQLISSHYDIFCRLNVLQSKILYDYLPRWHHEQQLINNGVEKVSTISLDTIQQWIEKIVDVIWRIKNQIKGLQLTLTDKPNVPFNTEHLDRFVLEINKTLENLIMNSFVVEKQPPQVMKTNTRFTATVRFLCGNKLNFQLLTPTVKALILSESNARTVIRYHKQLINKSWSQIENCLPQQQQQQQQQTGGVILSPSQSLASTPQPTNQQQQQQQHYQSNLPETNHQPTSAVSMMDHSPEQPMSSMSSDHQSSNSSPMQQQQQQPQQQQQQLFQQHQPPQQQAQFSNVTSTTAAVGATSTATSNMTAATNNNHQHHHHHQQQQQQQQQERMFGSITHIGYNPDVPINSKDFECSGEIINNSNILEFQESTGHMISQFKNMQLKKIKRTEKKGTESVMDEKFILLFFTNFRVADDSFWPYSIEQSSRVKRGDLFFHILAFSLPVVVIVHGNQEPHAWATITWHNAFACPDELLYRVPDKVSWSELGHVLSEKFRSCAGRGLSQHNLKCLASKVYRNRVDNDDVLISWNQFSKEPLSDKSFTFWEWFHSILKLTKEHLKDLWQAERIYGFVGKKGCMDLLLGSAYNEAAPIGTFLLRFSETELGGITIAWVSDASELSTLNNPQLNDRVQISQRLSPTNSSTNVVMHLQPFMGKDLHTRSLADRIRDLKDLIYLYPNIPKDEAFEAYYTDLSKMNHVSKSGYIPTMLISTLAANYPGTVGSAFQSEASVTPNSIQQNSPETYYHGESMSMNEVMENNYSHYEHQTIGEYNNYTIQ